MAKANSAGTSTGNVPDGDFEDGIRPDNTTVARKASALELPEGVKLKDMSLADLQALISFGDAAEVLESDQFGPVLTDKDVLVGTPFLLVEWEENPGDFGDTFVTLKVITMDGRRFIVNDGSSGISQQLKLTTEKTGRTVGMSCRKGLRKSEYVYTNDHGAEIPATTYYIDTSL